MRDVATYGFGHFGKIIVADLWILETRGTVHALLRKGTYSAS